MSYTISKELFEIVTGNKYGDFHFEKLLKNYDKLFFDCKRWAYNKGYVIFSSQQKTGWAVFIQTDSDGIIASFEGLEQQAVFDACQYILDKDKQ